LHIKRRGTRAMLYRSFWVAKGTNGNTHGYSTQQFVGSLPLDSVCLPDDLVGKISADELQFLERNIFEPARLVEGKRAAAKKHRETDPIWRLDDALRLVQDAAERSDRAAVPNVKVTALSAALVKVRTITQAIGAASPAVNSAAQPTPQFRTDPLIVARDAIKAARDAVLAGHYKNAPAEGVRNTHPYKLWAEIFDAIEGRNGSSLMQALQAKGFVKTREVRN
jgi:hypothetical protein